MPWEHCKQTISDDLPCPGCGISKEAWTLEWDRTREFVVSRARARPALRVLLVGPGDTPVPNEPIEVELPDGARLELTLDEYGTAKIKASEGLATLRFPRREPTDLTPPHEAELVSGAQPACYRCPLGPGQHVFRLLPELWVHLGIDPTAASSRDDRFVLRGVGPGEPFERVLTVRDDAIEGNATTDLHFRGLDDALRYSLYVYTSPEAEGEAFFEGLTLAEINARRQQ